ncbi:MAG: amidase [Rhodobacteraceae bacterium]|nr:amidase [Paracoccaceae bacterium]
MSEHGKITPNAPTIPLNDLSILDAGALLRAGTISAKDLAKDALARIGALDDKLNSFITLTTDRALADADAADADFANGIDKGPMQGIPYALKDIFNTAGIRTTCHSKLLQDHVPTSDCVVAEKLRSGGGVLIGKTATHEFAFGGPSFDLPFPPARNPWNPDHIPGGSSSGSGAAVAAGFVRMAMGSDTGGSIRGPAAYCGTVGLKPTYGLVSRRGVFPLSFTLDHAGPLSRSVDDTAATMQVIAGYDPLDPASADPGALDFLGGINDGIEGMKFAFPRHFFEDAEGVSDEVVSALDAAIVKLGELGATVDIVTLPDYELFNAAGRVILLSEAYAIHEADMKTRPLDYGRFTHARMAVGGLLSASDLMQALRVRRQLSISVNNTILGKYDAIIAASTLAPAGRFDEIDPETPPAWAIQTMPFNVTGNPAMSIPTGFSAQGLPLSMQIVGKPFADPTVLRIGKAYETAAGLMAHRPNITMAQAA